MKFLPQNAMENSHGKSDPQERPTATFITEQRILNASELTVFFLNNYCFIHVPTKTKKRSNSEQRLTVILEFFFYDL